MYNPLFPYLCAQIDDLSKRLQHFQPENLGLVQKLPHVLKKFSKGDFSGLEVKFRSSIQRVCCFVADLFFLGKISAVLLFLG